MSDEEHESMEDEMLKRHRKEKKELQAKIQTLKKTLSKGDKKKKKDVQDEIVKLELELTQRHSQQLQTLQADKKGATITCDGVCESTKRLSLESNAPNNATEFDASKEEHVRNISKAQKRRDRKEQQEKERLAEIKAQDLINIQGPRHVETTQILQVLKMKMLALHDIPSNGDCLFAAVCHQTNIGEGGDTLGEDRVSKLRKHTAKQIRQEKSEYQPFLTNPKTGEMLTDAEFEEYCNKMAETKAWGGQIELRAISQILGVQIEVIQAEGTPVVIGEGEMNKNMKRLILTYHRHYLGLGEHYNSTKPLLKSSDDVIDNETQL